MMPAPARWVLLVAVMTAIAAAQEPPPPVRPAETPPDIQVSNWVSRTALWVGDHLDYVIELTTPAHVEILEDDLAPEQVKLEGLVHLSTDRERIPRDDGLMVHRFRYRLTTYTTTPRPLRISAVNARYYILRAGQRPSDARPAGEVRILGAVLALRSTLPEQLPGLGLRDAGALQEVPMLARLAGPAGWGLIAAAATPIALWAAARLRDARRRGRRASPRAARSHARSALEVLHAAEVPSEAGRLEAFGRLEAALRRHLAEAHGLPAHALPAKELAARLDAAGAADTAGGMADLVAECERTRYGPPERLPPPERFAAALTAAEELVAGARR